MTIWELTEVLSNQSYSIRITNDWNFVEQFLGEVEEFTHSDLYDEIQDYEVTDMYTEGNGTLCICYIEEEGDE